ncbi:MAG TPA: MASE1 domain-containing protein [Steroidobacteraceae bacterium]|nr:MASE1 domain-containing protein [Steroidobacteraceae bacterium]
MNRTADALATGLPDDIELTTAAGSRASLVAVAGAHSYPRILLAAALVAITYGLTARLGAALHFPDVPVSAIWAPNAVLLAALLLVPRRYWWIYLAVLFPVHLLVQVSLTHTPLPQVLIQYGVNCATALIAAFALNAFVPHLQRIDRMRTAVAFIVLAGFVAPIFSSVLMAAAFVALHITDAFWLTVTARTLTNSFAILTLVPLALHGAAWAREGNFNLQPARATEAILLVITLTTVGILGFVAPGQVTGLSLSLALLYAPFAILLWATVRFGTVGACGATLLLGLLSTWGVLNHQGPFAAGPPEDDAVSLLLFLVLTTVSLLLLAAALEERRYLQHAGAESEARFRTIFAHSLVPKFLWRADGRILDANESFFRLTGYDRDALRSGAVPMHALLAPLGEGGNSVSALAQLDFDAQGDPVERKLVLRDGRHIPVLIGGCRFPGSANEGTAYVFDLSSLRRAESERRQAERLHSAVLASVHDQIVVLDQAGVIIETNQSWRRFVEHSASRPFERAYVGDHYLQACNTAAEAGDTIAAELRDCIRDVLGGISARRSLEFSRDSPDGSLWYEIAIERLRRPEGGAVITRADITAHKQAITQAREQRLQLAHLGRAAVLGELSGAFAHELAQPLTSILGNAEAALELLPPDTPGLREIQDMLRDIIKDDVRAAEVIQRLRSMLARGEIQRRPVDLNQVVRDVLALARSDLITRNVTVVTQLDSQAALVLADPVQLQQVLLNLIVNACEAMSASPPSERRLTIATRPADEGRAIECSVADHGCGIRPGDLERIFEPFVTTKKQGLGLGLAICRSIIEAHGGRLWADNAAEHCGAVFHFTASVGA